MQTMRDEGGWVQGRATRHEGAGQGIMGGHHARRGHRRAKCHERGGRKGQHVRRVMRWQQAMSWNGRASCHAGSEEGSMP